VYVLAALACRDARSDGARFDLVGAFNGFPADSFPAQLSPFKLVVRLVWDAGEYGRFLVGMRLVDAAGADRWSRGRRRSRSSRWTWRTWPAARSS
jgi:hypothetical protein